MTAPAGLPRLLLGLDAAGGAVSAREHERIHGPLPRLRTPVALIGIVEQSGLRGRGGAGFPTGAKLRAVALGQDPSLVVNGSETEPASAKDALLLERLPHLVLDGAVLAGRAIAAREVIVSVPASARAVPALEQAIAERGDEGLPIRLHLGDGGYVSGEETALLSAIGGGAAKPAFVPPRPFEKGLRGRPTLIQNAETLAHVALIARHGADWYRRLGPPEDPGSTLVTISGAVARPGVYELALGTAIGDLLAAAGGAREPLQALLIGGYFGTWLPIARAQRLSLTRTSLSAEGCSLGAGVVIALGESACGLHESARIAGWLAGESAGQCGPCVYGLDAIASSMARLARGEADERELPRLRRWCAEVAGRGACHHPDGVIRFVSSALTTFADEVPRHRTGRCGRAPSGLPIRRGRS